MKHVIPALLAVATACGPSVSAEPDAPVGGPDANESPDAGPQPDSRPPPDNTAVYAHSATELFRIDPDTLVPTSVGTFSFSGTAKNITDIAVDKNGDMIGISLDTVYAIDRDTAEATLLSTYDSGGSGMTSLSFVPTDINDPDSSERLVAADFDGVVWEIDPDTGDMTEIGNYNASGADIGSSGDIVAIFDFGIVATVNVEGYDTDYLARIDPTTWHATLLGDTGYDSIFGLGFWGGEVYGFTDNKEFVTIDADTGQVVHMTLGSVAWWGAGVTTLAPIVN